MVKNYTNLYWYGYKPAALFACLIIGYAVSLLTPRRQHGLEGLTMFDIEQAISSMTGGYA